MTDAELGALVRQALIDLSEDSYNWCDVGEQLDCYRIKPILLANEALAAFFVHAVPGWRRG